MVQQRPRRRKRLDTTKLLMMAVGVLAVILVVVLCVALLMKPASDSGTNQPTQTETQGPTKPLEKLTVQYPQAEVTVTTEQQLEVKGLSDLRNVLTVNGTEVTREEDGSFSYTVTLEKGENTLVISDGVDTYTFTVTYRYAIEKCYPSQAQTFSSGATIRFSVSARKGSAVTAEFNGKTINLTLAKDQNSEIHQNGFDLYEGTYKLPSTNTTDLDLGVITYTVTCDGYTEQYQSGNITCTKSAEVLGSNPGVTPDYGDYIDVGSGYIVEIITYSAETFYGDTRDDNSDPRNNYLPKGTLDYGKTDVVYDTTGKIQYRVLRCGYRVYTQRKNYPDPNGRTEYIPVVDCYKGTLPDHNEIGFASLTLDGSHTVLTFDCLWKAPFYFDVNPVTYNDPEKRDFKITGATAQYIDITFCYATSFEGTVQIPSDNPLFKSAELKQNASDCTLRLYLKQTGGFYGWDCYYNENDQLCFRFLNPTPAKEAENKYGADLTGLRVMIDVGHGGIDGGTPGTAADGKKVTEADLNLALALKLRAELESMGATVIMNREDNKNLTVDQRIQHFKNQMPDLCIAIHHNSYAALSSVNGCDIMYFGPQSHAAAQAIYKQVNDSGVYKKTMLKWNVYYMARETVCPLVLAECGYLTNPDDLAGAMDDATVQRKAESIAQGVADYFLSIN